MDVGDTARVLATDDVGEVYKVHDADGRRRYWLDFKRSGAVDRTIAVRNGDPIAPDGPYDEEELEPWR